MKGGGNWVGQVVFACAYVRVHAHAHARACVRYLVSGGGKGGGEEGGMAAGQPPTNAVLLKEGTSPAVAGRGPGQEGVCTHAHVRAWRVCVGIAAGVDVRVRPCLCACASMLRSHTCRRHHQHHHVGASHAQIAHDALTRTPVSEACRSHTGACMVLPPLCPLAPPRGDGTHLA